jgi:hypothetical protein
LPVFAGVLIYSIYIAIDITFIKRDSDCTNNKYKMLATASWKNPSSIAKIFLQTSPVNSCNRSEKIKVI